MVVKAILKMVVVNCPHCTNEHKLTGEEAFDPGTYHLIQCDWCDGEFEYCAGDLEEYSHG